MASAVAERLSQRELDTLLGAYRRAETRIRSVIARQASTAFARARARILLEQIEDIVRELEAHNTRWLYQRLPRYYQEAQREVAIEMGEPLPAFSRVNRGQVEVLAMAAAADSTEALQSIVPRLGRVFHEAAQRVIEEQGLDAAIAQGVAEGLGSREVTSRIVETLMTGATERLRGVVDRELADQLAEVAEGKYIRILCKDGKWRTYSLQWYGETIARTMHAEASTEATLQTVVEYGGDLVQWSSHAGACVPLCVPLQGRIYSISGRNPDFPPLTPETRPPVHPWCAHGLLPVSETILRQRGQYERMAQRSRQQQPVAVGAGYATA